MLSQSILNISYIMSLFISPSKFFLIYLLFLNFIFIFILFLIPRKYIKFIKTLSLIFSFIIFFYSVFIFCSLDPSILFYKHVKIYMLYSSLFFSVGVDWISIYFILLTTFLIPLCLLINWWSIYYRVKDFILLLFILEFFLLNIFLSLDIFFFYIFFEGVLFPMFFMIGIWGARQRKIHAVYQFFFYTFFGSMFMLLGFLIIFLHTGTTSLLILSNFFFSYNRQIFLWFCFFLAFSIKVPMMPFHIWLPEAHVEAPTSGSILLAGILLKLGTYGFLRFLIQLFPLGMKFFTPLLFVITIISIVYGSIATIRQIDLKKIIAYSSIVHMNFAIIGLLTFNIEGIQGSFFLMISHGIVSSALFFCIGILYDRYHTRILYYYGGLVQVMPLYSVIFFIFILSNMGFPGTSGFVGEILIFLSVFLINWKIGLLLSLGIFFSGIYCLWLFNRVIFGEIKTFYFIKNKTIFYKNFFYFFRDVNKREFLIAIPLLLFNFILGIYPNCIFFFTKLIMLNLLII